MSRRIAVLGTGGTIASRLDEHGAAEPVDLVGGLVAGLDVGGVVGRRAGPPDEGQLRADPRRPCAHRPRGGSDAGRPGRRRRRGHPRDRHRGGDGVPPRPGPQRRAPGGADRRAAVGRRAGCGRPAQPPRRAPGRRRPGGPRPRRPRRLRRTRARRARHPQGAHPGGRGLRPAGRRRARPDRRRAARRRRRARPSRAPRPGGGRPRGAAASTSPRSTPASTAPRCRHSPRPARAASSSSPPARATPTRRSSPRSPSSPARAWSSASPPGSTPARSRACTAAAGAVPTWSRPAPCRWARCAPGRGGSCCSRCWPRWATRTECARRCRASC